MLKLPQRKIPITKIGELVRFDESSHTYLLNGRKFISATTLVSKYKPKFDESGEILERCAFLAKTSKEEMQARWNKKRDDACDFGKKIHLEIEDYIKFRKPVSGQVAECVKKINEAETVYPEVKLCSPKFAVAGTSDLVRVFSNGEFDILDWKTNSKFSTPMKNPYRKPMLNPISDLGDSSWETYSLQLWCYCIMLEEFGYKSKQPPTIIWMSPKGGIQEFKALPLRNHALKIMQHHFESRK
jgi:hypothetical protein